MKVAYLSSAYLAPVEYYSKLLNYDKIFIEQHDHYMKQTYRNRCTIAGPEGELALSIPTVKPEGPKCPMKDIRISDHGNWRHLHWNAIESAYNSTPFFEYYKDDFRPFYEKKYEFLTDFNEELCRLVCELIVRLRDKFRICPVKIFLGMDRFAKIDFVRGKVCFIFFRPFNGRLYIYQFANQSA